MDPLHLTFGTGTHQSVLSQSTSHFVKVVNMSIFRVKRAMILTWMLLWAVLASSEEAELHLWIGVGSHPEMKLRFDVETSSTETTQFATIILISEGGIRVPADSFSLKDDEFRLSAMNGAIQMSGKADGETVVGEMRIPSGTLPMFLAKQGSADAVKLLASEEQVRRELRMEPLKLKRVGPGLDTVDSDALDSLLSDAETNFTTSMAIIHNGQLVGEWHRGDSALPIETMSVTKIALNLLIGRMITLGYLDSIDTPVHEFFPAWAEDEERRHITIRHLLNHSSGLNAGQPAGPIYQQGDFVSFALDAPLDVAPGEAVIYSNNGTNLLAGIIGLVVGMPLSEFLARDLFGYLGIEEFVWRPDRVGNPQGMAGLSLRATDLARLGQLALNNGNWDGRQLIDEGWFTKSFQPGSHLSDRVGLLWFLDRDAPDGPVVGASHSGHLGQWLGIRFDNQIVAARLIAESPGYDPSTDVFEDFIQRLKDLAP